MADIHDFNGDGRSDILLRRDDGTITNLLGQPDGARPTNNRDNFWTLVDPTWVVAGVGDFNGDGRSDILWRNASGALFNFLGTPQGGVLNNGDNSWQMVDNSWQVAGVGDFNGDRRADILFRDADGTIINYLGQANGGFLDNSFNLFTEVSTDWKVAGIGDFNGDGKDDILWRHLNGAIFDFLGTETGGVVNNGDNLFTLVDNSWRVVGTGDFNGDGRSDILWRNESGAIFDFLGTANGGVLNNGDNSWAAVSPREAIVGIGDYHGDGFDDILWQHAWDEHGNVIIQTSQGTPAGGFTAGFWIIREGGWHVQDPQLYLTGAGSFWLH